MRDTGMTKGPKRYYDDLEAAHQDVVKAYPGVLREGSVGAWSWAVGGEIVAEAWLHATRPGWWVRIKPL